MDFLHSYRRRAGEVIATIGALVLGASGAALAQGDADDSDDVVDEIVVTGTGSNIRGAPPVGSALLNITPDDEISAGVSDVSQLLLRSPQVTNIGFSENQRAAGGSGNASYMSAINLRGIGPDSTLTLMDGQRIVSVGTGAFAIDPSAFPMSMIQRIDIVPDGTSAIYGSDAVAGVVNIILRRLV